MFKVFLISNSGYLDGKTRKDEIDDTIGIRNAIWLNKFPKILQENPEGILVKVGGLHLFSETGFVTHFYKEGWTIERADIDANFHPIELSGDFYPVDFIATP